MWEELLVKIPNYAFVCYAVFISIELVFALIYNYKLYRLNDTLACLSMGAAYVGMRALTVGFTLMLMHFYQQYAFFDIESNWLSFIACYIVMDFLVYCYHRSTHQIRFGWAAHVAHHSSQQFNLGATPFRQSWAEPLLEPFAYSLIALIGFDPYMALVALEVNLIYMFWVHLEKVGKLHPLFEWLFSTPSHHRVHHANNTQYLDKNFGGTFMIWDRMFGTFEEEKEKPVFGLVTQLNSNSPITASFHLWITLVRDIWYAKGLRNKLAYLVMPPGWAPDGKGQTSRQKQAIYKQDLLYRDRQ
jgi:sterol desaturase/sphingolipid hydroxylase (fatty acid hydroxylase superfamily)|tara:strand:- start:487 stop:1389 length:903 start_codon:yes stop_codon:yes gene_type:complete